MKNIFIKPIFLSILSIGLFTSCVNDDEFAIPKIVPVYFSEEFDDIDFKLADSNEPVKLPFVNNPFLHP